MNTKHATVKIDGMDIPLIGVPEAATEEECEKCHQRVHITKCSLQEGKMVCDACRGNDEK